MTIVSSKDFTINQKRIYDLAQKEQVVIRRGKNIFHLVCGHIENNDTDDDYADLIEAKAYINDENTSADDFIRFLRGVNG